MNKKILSLVLVTILLLGNILNVSASEKKMYYISAYTSSDDSYITLPILESGDEAYIGVADVSLLTGMNYEKSGKKNLFTKDKHTIEYTGKTITHNGQKYYHLKNVMDELSTTYKYSEKTETLCFFPCKSFISNLLNDCWNVYSNKGFNYSIDFIANTWGVELAVLIDILRTGAVDAIWGGYQREQFEKAISGILLPSESQSEMIELATDGHDIMDTLLKVYEASGEILGESEMSDFLGVDTTGVMAVYKRLSMDGMSLESDDILDLMETIYTAKNASQTYVNAVKHGLYNNKNIQDPILKNAIKTVYMYYDENQPELVDILNGAGITAVENIAKNTIENYFQLKNPYLTLMNIALDEFLQFDKITGATTQGLICYQIQQEALKQFKLCFDTRTATPKNPLQMKYSILLYLRATQYSMEQFAFTEQGKYSAASYSEGTQKAIDKLVAYSDEELTREVNNGTVNFKWNGFRTNADEVVTGGGTVQKEENESTAPETSIPSNPSTNDVPSNSGGGSSANTTKPSTTPSKFAMVDLIGKTAQEAKTLLEANGYKVIMDGELVFDIYQNDTRILWSWDIYDMSSVIMTLESVHDSNYPVTKELNSKLTYTEAKNILETAGYKVNATEEIKQVRLTPPYEEAQYAQIPCNTLNIQNKNWTVKIIWEGAVLIGAYEAGNVYKLKDNYNISTDTSPSIFICSN